VGLVLRAVISRVTLARDKAKGPGRCRELNKQRGDRGIEASVPSLVGKLLVSYFSRSKSRSKLAVINLVARVSNTFVGATTTIDGVPVVPVISVEGVVAFIPLHPVRIA
jgi:hypothetical protein